MHTIKDSEVAAAFKEKESEYMESTDPEILAEYKELFSDVEHLRHNIAVLKDKAAKRYRKFVDEFCREYARNYKETQGHTYFSQYGKMRVLDADDRFYLMEEYKQYLRKLFLTK